MDQTSDNPRKISGQLSWGNNEPSNASSNVPANEGAASGPLTGKSSAPKPVAKQGRSSRRNRKSEGAFRTISEVADVLDVQQHVLRFWETKFSQVRPLKRGGGRRYYRPEDLALLTKIHHLLYTEGYTIKGVQKLLKEQGKKALIENMPKPVAANNVQPSAKPQSVPSSVSTQVSKLESVLDDLKDMRKLLNGAS